MSRFAQAQQYEGHRFKDGIIGRLDKLEQKGETMTEKRINRTILTPPFRAAFPKLFQPEQRVQSDPKKYYGVEAIFPPDADLSTLKKLASDVAKEHWGDNVPKKLISPFKNGNEYNEDRESPRPELTDCVFMRLNTTTKPDVVDIKRQAITDESEIYPGCWMRASIYCHPHDNRTDKTRANGITFLLNNVQKLKDDEPWGAQRKSAFADFDDNVSESSEIQEEFSDDDNIDW